MGERETRRDEWRRGGGIVGENPRNVVEGKNPATWDKMAAERFESEIRVERKMLCGRFGILLGAGGEDAEGKDPVGEGKDP